MERERENERKMTEFIIVLIVAGSKSTLKLGSVVSS